MPAPTARVYQYYDMLCSKVGEEAHAEVEEMGI